MHQHTTIFACTAARVFLTWVAVCCACATGMAQTTLSVYDAETLEPVPFATVEYMEETSGRTTGTTTDTDGRAELGHEAVATATVRHMGYEDRTVSLNGDDHRTVYLTVREEELREMVVTGLVRARDKADVIYDVDVVDRDQIERQAANDLTQVLANRMNVRPQRDGILGSSISLQGMQGRDIKILLDGVPLIGRQNGTIDLSQINLANIERIEIIEGPMSVLYGTDAHGGTINLITKKDQTEDIDATVDGFYESSGQYNISAYGGLSTDRHTVRLGGGRFFFDGWSATPGGRSHDWDPKENAFAELSTVHRFERPWTLTTRADYMNERILNRYERPSSLSTVALEDWYITRRFNQNISLDGRIGTKWAFTQTLSYQYFQRSKNAYSKDLTDLTVEMLPDTSGQDNQDTSRMHQVLARGMAVYEPGDRWQLSLGYEAQYERLSTSRVQGGEPAAMTTAEAFASVRFRPVDAISLQAGVRYGYNSVFPLLPAPSLHIQARPTDRWTVRASYGFGYRTPTNRELYFEFIDNNHRIFGNPDLTPERSHNVQLGADGRYEVGSVTLSPSASAFFLHKDNTIAYTQTGIDGDLVPIFVLENISVIRATGMNGGLTAEGDGWSIGATAGVIGRYNAYADDFDIAPYLFSPELQVNGEYTVPRINTTISLFTKFNGPLRNFFFDDEDGIQRTRIDAFTLMDLTVRQPIWHDRIIVRAGLRNLLNVGTVNSTAQTGAHSGGGGALMGMGRTVFVGLTLRTNAR